MQSRPALCVLSGLFFNVHQLILCTVSFLSGGLAEEVDEKVLHAAFIPFGDITDIQIPLDYETGKDRSFMFLCNMKHLWVR